MSSSSFLYLGCPAGHKLGQPNQLQSHRPALGETGNLFISDHALAGQVVDNNHVVRDYASDNGFMKFTSFPPPIFWRMWTSTSPP